MEVFNMGDVIVLAVIAVSVVIAIRSGMEHFKGNGGCCGGTVGKVRKKKLSHIAYRKTFHVEGMYCNKCKNRVETAVDELDGVAGKVNLKKGELVVSYQDEVEDQKIIASIEKVGYRIRI